MSSANSVRAGRAFVEITADDTPFQRKIKTLGNRAARVGANTARTSGLLAMQQSISAVATSFQPLMVAAGAAAAAVALPLAGAVRAAASFQDQLAELKGAVSDLSPKQFADVRAEAMRLSSELRVGPTEAAAALTLLIKAGMKVKEALGGAGKAAIQFAKVSGVEVTQAAEFMKVSMNVFGRSAAESINTLSAAADASETDIAAMVEGFSQIAGVAKGTNQSLFGISQAMAILAQYGIRGEEAGTGLKTVLTKLLAPTDEAKKALATMGLSMESFVDASGKMLPLAQIAAIFAKQMRGMSKSAREAMLSNEALVKVFDVRGIKIIQAFADAGEDGFSRVAKEMENARSVSEKYDEMMKGLSGVFNGIMAAVSRLAVEVGSTLTPVFRALHNVLVPVLDVATALFNKLSMIANIGEQVTDKVAESLIPGLSLYRQFQKVRGGDNGNTIKRDVDGTPMAGAGAPGGAAAAGVDRETVGTFNGSALGQLGIGPSLAAAQATAQNTAEMAASLEQIKNATTNAAKQADGGVAQSTGTANGVRVATLDREMLSASERTALVMEKVYDLLRQNQSNPGSGMVYA